MFRPLLLTAALLPCAAAADAMDRELVLVAGSRSSVGQLSIPDARKAYLGLPVRIGGQPLKPVRNETDPVATEIFLQKVLFMTASDYERQINTRVGRAGGGRPAAYDNLTDLIIALQRDPMAVSYMPRSEARSRTGLKILAVP